MAKYAIENMSLTHLDDIMEIEEKCYGLHHWSRSSFAGELENMYAKYLTVVNEEKKCVGYMGVWRIIDEAHITNLAVHPDFQGCGLARFLILASLDDCYREKIKYMTLEVRKTNYKAQKLYESFGFKSLGYRKKYYQDNGEDALIMWTENIFTDRYKQIYEDNKKLIQRKLLV